MRIKKEVLIADLIERCKQLMNEVENFKQLSKKQLNWRKEETSWSVLECIEHLNLYGNFYLPELKMRITHASLAEEEYFKSGRLGNYFVMSMLPKEKLNKMKTFKDKNPLGSQLDESVLDEFLRQQQQLLQLLDKARKVSLTNTKVSISISKWIKLRLGDTFRFFIYHEQRHIVQAKKVIEQMPSNF